jgi:hypothetical protein
MLQPFHHGDGTPGSGPNLLQNAIDSQAGTIAGAFLHTFGALLFTAGLVLYLYQAHLARRAQTLKQLPTLRLLPFAHAFNLAGIAMNGLGGLMRLYQSDHPRLEQLGTSAWVQFLFVKHLFLLVGIGLAVLLTYRTHTLSLRDDAPQAFMREARRMTGFAYTAFGTILLASILGAFAAGQPLTMAPATTPGAAMSDGMGHAVGGQHLAYNNASGTITGTPVMPGREQAEIHVPPGSSQLWMELTWVNAQASSLDLTLLNPSGGGMPGHKVTSSGRVVFDLSGSLLPGTWRAAITSSRAANERYTLIVRITVGSPLGPSLEQTLSVNPSGAGPSQFVEINLKMKRNDNFTYTWEVLDSTQKLDFNIHLHANGQVSYPVRGNWNTLSGTYQHTATDTDGVSLMWENANSATLRVHVRIVGNFTTA